jgi:hypothetical protein
VVTLLRDVALPGRPGRGCPPGYRQDLRIPAVLLIALLSVPLLVYVLVHAGEPWRLSETRLAGPRLLTGRACVIVAADLSGSMAAVTPLRQAAVAALLPWLKINLRADDLVMLVNFTDDATVALPATQVDRLPTVPPAESPVGGRGTVFGPAVAIVGDALADRRCGAVELLAISDGVFSDDPRALGDTLKAAGVTRMHVLNPNGDVRPFPLNQAPLASVDVRALGDTNRMSLSFGEAIAALTGQRLATSWPPTPAAGLIPRLRL